MATVSEQLIYVTADEPLLIFSSVEKAAAYIEWPDVEDGLYRGFDGAGREVRFDVDIRVQRRRFGGFRNVKSVVYTVALEPTHAEELRQTLIQALSVDAARLVDLEAASLEQLQQIVVDRFGITY